MIEKNVTQKKFKIAFSIPQYMLSLILPKCNIIYGEIVSSVYLQIAMHINHQKNSVGWKKNSAWIKTKNLSLNTGYNIRLINSTLKILEELKLISINKQNKIVYYQLQNNQLTDMEEIIKYNNFVEYHLLGEMNKTKTEKFTLIFKKLNEIVNLNNSEFNKYLTKNAWFQDINLLRNLVIQSEKIYKGSSLFFVNNLAPTIFEVLNTSSVNNMESLNNISQNYKSLMNGSSQSTINRYIKHYVIANFLIKEENKIKLNIDLFSSEEDINLKVVNNMNDEKGLICPICQKEFSESRSLNFHIAKVKDEKHILLNHLRKQLNCKPNDLNNLYLQYKADFDELNDDKIKVKDEYLKVPCDCKMSCKECYKNWKLDFYNDCKNDRKQAFIEEYNIKSKEVNKVANDYDIVQPVKTRKSNPDSAPSLVKYFYSLNNLSSPNWGKESSQVKNLLNQNVTPDQIRLTMDYLNRRGNVDLRFLNRSINDALLEQRYLKDTEKEDTEAFLVKMYYDGLSLPLNLQTLNRDVQKIRETINSGLTYEQTKIVIQYMIDIKCPTLNFIGNKKTEALAKASKKKQTNSNPSFYDRDDLVIIKNELINGRMNLKKVNDKFKFEAKKLAENIFENSLFSPKYTHFEWAWKIGLDLTDKMYDIGLNTQSNKGLILDNVLNDPNITPEQRDAVLKIKERFNEWLNIQTQKFKSVQNN